MAKSRSFTPLAELWGLIVKTSAVAGCAAFILSQQPAHAADPQTFASPKAAFASLVDAAGTDGAEGIIRLLGADTREWITSGDPDQDRRDIKRFISAYDWRHRITEDGADATVLSVGDDDFPFPFPVVRRIAGGWAFDAERGKQEMLNRRIGRNELNTIGVMMAIADAQREYATSDHDGDGLLEYATRLASSEGNQDGLYWPPTEGEPLSPLGALVAKSGLQGRASASGVDADGDRQPPTYHGYRYKLLTGQGEAAPGGAYDYEVDGLAIGGFAVLAVPARHGNSGVMSFIISHDGVIYDADLGPDADEDIETIDIFDPIEGWLQVDPKPVE